jgi:hypothetical protein
MECVRTHESGNGRYSRNIYGMLDGWAQAGGRGKPEDATRAEQDYRAWLLFNWAARRYGSGTAAWRPYDGC